MTVFNAHRSAACAGAPARAGAIGLLVGLVAGFQRRPRSAPPTGSCAPTFAPSRAGDRTTPVDPAKQLPGTISVSNIDFKRGDGGAGQLILTLQRRRRAPGPAQRRARRSSIDVGNAQLPANLQSRSTSPTSPRRCSASTRAPPATARSWC